MNEQVLVNQKYQEIMRITKKLSFIKKKSGVRRIFWKKKGGLGLRLTVSTWLRNQAKATNTQNDSFEQCFIRVL